LAFVTEPRNLHSRRQPDKSMDPASWRQIRGLIFDALQRPPSEREAFLRERCAEPVLTESLTLLKTCEADSSTLESLQSDTDDVEKADTFADLQPGTHVGQYVILDRLGRGGMGQVFLSRDQELHRKVALKCLLSSGADLERERARIKAEARAAAAITHVNVAAIHHVIEHGTRAFIVMEYVEGESLSTRLKRERLTTEQVVAIGRQLVAALRAAHAQEVVHRDLKPGNIQLTPDGLVKVLDFGIAQTTWPVPTASSTGAETASATCFVGTRMARGGTPPYMSPEQLLGHAVDERSDIYSLGIVLFEMATGRRPYPGVDPFELVQAQVKGAPRADAIDPRVPRGLADVIAKALQIDLSMRFQTALEVGAALDAFEQTLRPKSVRRREQIRRWLARAAIALPTAVLGLGAIGFVATAGFNNTFGRTADFARFGTEPLSSYFRWGLLAIVPSLVVMTLAVLSFIAGRFLFGALELIGPIGRIGRRVRMTWSAVALKIGLDDPNMLAQALCCIGILFIGAMFWFRFPLILAVTSFFNSGPIDRLLAMGPQEYWHRQSYQITLDVVTPAFAFGLWRVIQLRKLKNFRGGSTGVGLLIGILTIIVLMRQWPYRTLNQRDFERVDLAGARCYITGQSDDEYLILCPGGSPPRNRAVKRDDPALRRLHIVENVFNGVASPRSDP
jgi:serine/threonine protein kinase